MAERFDVLVIGGGPGGYVAAIRAAQLGLRAACVEQAAYADPKGEVRLGGTCLNVGCIPSKALLQSSELYDQAGHAFVMHGIGFEALRLDLRSMMQRKENIVTRLTGGIRGLFKKNGVTLLAGRGRLVGKSDERWQVAVGGETFEATHVVLATGSSARTLPGVEVDNVLVCDNVGALSFDSVPKRLGVIGAGVIGLELGSVWKRLGSQVTILEALPDFLGAADADIAREAWKVFTTRQGLEIVLGASSIEVERGAGTVSVRYEAGDEPHAIEVDRLIVSVGRVPNSGGLGAEPLGLALDGRGFIAVDEHCRTNLENLWAVGDVVRGPMLAHKGMEEGVMVAEIIAGQAGHVDYEAIPWVIYTQPEIAWVGRTEAQLRRDGVEYRVGKVPFSANGRALGQGDTTGFVKVLAEAASDRVLGVHIIGTNASELISGAVVAMEFGAAAEDLARICHAHPTLSEVVHEAALAVENRSIHF
ncbi:MAG: dihydrolipoyl dehydrogenase [Rhodocyclaceae bacterium]